MYTPTIININLLLEACEYTVIPLGERTNPNSEITHCLYIMKV